MSSPAVPAASSSSTPASTVATSASLHTIAPSDGSRTLVLVQPQQQGAEGGSHDETSILSGSLRLRGGPRTRPRVVWDTNVIDNEHMGKKKSKICCIYHKPKEFDESSEESSDSDSDVSSAPSDDDRARPSQRSRRRYCSHDSYDGCDATPPSSSNDVQYLAHSTDINVTLTHQHQSNHHQHQHQHHYHHSDKNAYESQPLIKGKGRTNGN